MKCAKYRVLLAGYLDGTLAGGEHAGLHEHVEACEHCRRELDRYRRLSALVSRLDPAQPPADLAARIRLNVALARQQQPWLERAWGRLQMTAQNFLAPLAVPATGGLASALLVFAVMFHSLLFGLPLGAVPNDVPINLIRSASLERLAPFSGIETSDERPGGDGELLLVEAVVDAQGHAVNYNILSGPDSPALRRQLNQVVFLSHYRPQMSFGRPEAGGRVILSFSQIRVKG